LFELEFVKKVICLITNYYLGKAIYNQKLFPQLFMVSKLKTIRCECGAEILFIPDVKEMGRVIECHAEEHRKRVQNPVEGDAAFERVENFLLKQVLGRAAFEGGWKE
jgi:hypothetical protein